jgi:hypothetical protein
LFLHVPASPRLFDHLFTTTLETQYTHEFNKSSASRYCSLGETTSD